jgi:hypothetical protein
MNEPNSDSQILYIAIDNGFTGAVAALLPNNQPVFHPVCVDDFGKDRYLNIRANLENLERILEQAKCSKERSLVLVEKFQPNPKFGTNNFVNGRNEEFWRMLLTEHRFPFKWVFAKSWQAHLFAGVRGKNTALKARMILEQRFPTLSLKNFTVPQREGISDAILISLWASETLGRSHAPTFPSPQSITPSDTK